MTVHEIKPLRYLTEHEEYDCDCCDEPFRRCADHHAFFGLNRSAGWIKALDWYIDENGVKRPT